MSHQEIIHSYRHLLRALLRAVQFSYPAKPIAVSQLRKAFREEGAVYDADGIKRTRWFLEAAARERGLEHRIVKNLVRVEGERRTRTWARWKGGKDQGSRKSYVIASKAPDDAFMYYDMTVAMLNHSMGTLLR